jgi:hypothetical protein
MRPYVCERSSLPCLDPTQIPPAKRTSPFSFLKVYQSFENWFSKYGTFQARRIVFISIRVEHALNFIRIICLRKRQREQEARFPWLQVITGDESPFGQTGASHYPAGGNPAA